MTVKVTVKGIQIRYGITPLQSSHTIPPTTDPNTQNPQLSMTAWPIAPLAAVDVVAAAPDDESVPFGSVPFNMIVLVPFTSPTCTNELFCAARLPLPIKPSR